MSGRHETPGPVALFSHVVTDEVYAPDGGLRARTVGGAGAYAAVGASLVAPSQRPLIVSGVGTADRPRLRDWFRARRIDPGGLFDVGEHSPVTRVRYRADGERVEESLYGHAHFAAHTPYPSRMPPRPEQLAGAYLFHGADTHGTDTHATDTHGAVTHGTDTHGPDTHGLGADDVAARFWREVPGLRARCAGPVLWEIAADSCSPGHLPRVLELAGLVDVLSLNIAEATALTGHRDPLDALDRLPRTRTVTVLRCGAAGSLVQDGRRRVRVGVAPGAVADPTGGGNAYSGAFLTAFAATGDIVSAARLAASAAARVIGQYGAPPVGEEIRAEVRDGATKVFTAEPT
ncbi:PfkB family carbohydrate kinase [Streptomyces sp. NPDC056161]|uniref:PfkB family carbohydrate kinase n=1 Tax=Streptomyces sp. NPDC056161 TaxID=3345732 RepID=UPI0035E02F69